jgi:hypothetical protein
MAGQSLSIAWDWMDIESSGNRASDIAESSDRDRSKLRSRAACQFGGWAIPLSEQLRVGNFDRQVDVSGVR